jgi:hypothetical protein
LFRFLISSQFKLWQESEIHLSKGIIFKDVIDHLPEDIRLPWATFLLECQESGQYSDEPEPGSPIPPAHESPPDTSSNRPPRPRPRPVIKGPQSAIARLAKHSATLRAVYAEVPGEVPEHALQFFAKMSQVLEECGPMNKIVADTFKAWSIPDVDARML